jgi:hypothetical protein
LYEASAGKSQQDSISTNKLGMAICNCYPQLAAGISRRVEAQADLVPPGHKLYL